MDRPEELTELSIPLDFYLLGRFWRAELRLRTTRHGTGAEAEATTIRWVCNRIFIYLSTAGCSLAIMPLRAKITTNNMNSSTSLQEQLEKAVLEGKVPQAVVWAAGRDGMWFFFVVVL